MLACGCETEAINQSVNKSLSVPSKCYVNSPHTLTQRPKDEKGLDISTMKSNETIHTDKQKIYLCDVFSWEEMYLGTNAKIILAANVFFSFG